MFQTKQETENYDVFISYRHETGFYMAQVIFDKLNYNGYSVFMDKTMDSVKVEEQIKEAIGKSRNFVMVLFPHDLDRCTEESDWLKKEAEWAMETEGLNVIPVLCDGFRWPKELPAPLQMVQNRNGVTVHKDYSLDQDLDKLCDRFLKNANPIKPMINTEDFFKNNLSENAGMRVERVDMAFHAGAAWLRPGNEKEILQHMIERKIPLRILINTPEAAESIARYMRDETALYTGFDQARAVWKRIAEQNRDFLEVRECAIPLIHVHHGIRFSSLKNGAPYGRLHIKYYAYNNVNLNRSFEHEISSFSNYYKIYENEFEYLWKKSKAL